MEVSSLTFSEVCDFLRWCECLRFGMVLWLDDLRGLRRGTSGHALSGEDKTGAVVCLPLDLGAWLTTSSAISKIERPR